MEFDFFFKQLKTRPPPSLVSHNSPPASQDRARGLEPWPSGVDTAGSSEALRRGSSSCFGILGGGSLLLGACIKLNLPLHTRWQNEKQMLLEHSGRAQEIFSGVQRQAEAWREDMALGRPMQLW